MVIVDESLVQVFDNISRFWKIVWGAVAVEIAWYDSREAMTVSEW